MLITFFKRICLGVLSLIMVVVLITSIIFLSPVDPARLTFGQQFDNEMLEQKRKSLGLDLPLRTQLVYYLRDISPVVFSKQIPSHLREKVLARIPLGITNLVLKKPYLRESYQTGRAVSKMIWQALPSTLLLALSAIIIAMILGILFGLISALNEGCWIDDFLLTLSTLGYSIPSYVSAIVFALVFGYLLHHVTGLNIQGGLKVLNDLGDEVWMPRNLILPSIALGVRPVSVILQITRSAALDVLEQPYVLLAKAKGLSKKMIILKYVLRNSLNPILTATTGWFASLLSGAFFVESVFNFRGFGQLTITALLNYDVPLLLGCILTVSVIFIFINLSLDSVYRMIDPRVE